MMRPLAENCDGRATFALGLMEARGDLGQPDYAKARAWWKKRPLQATRKRNITWAWFITVAFSMAATDVTRPNAISPRP